MKGHGFKNLASSNFPPLNEIPEKSKFISEDRYENEGPLTSQINNKMSNLSLEEHTLGMCDDSSYTILQNINDSNIQNDQSFINSSLNTIANLNEDLAEEQIAENKSNFRQDFKGHISPEGYLKLNVLVPIKGELICKQHIIDISSIKILGTKQTSLGKTSTNKQSYTDYMLGRSLSDNQTSPKLSDTLLSETKANTDEKIDEEL